MVTSYPSPERDELRHADAPGMFFEEVHRLEGLRAALDGIRSALSTLEDAPRPAWPGREPRRAVSERREAPMAVVRLSPQHAPALPPTTSRVRDLQVPRAEPASRRAAAGPPRLRPHPQYPVGLYRIEEVHGLGDEHAQALKRYGVNLTDELLHADLDRLAEATGIARSRLQRWRDMAELMSLTGVGSERADRLVRLGIGSIRGLAMMEPERLAERLVAQLRAEDGSEARLELAQRTLPAWCRKVVQRAREANARL